MALYLDHLKNTIYENILKRCQIRQSIDLLRRYYSLQTRLCKIIFRAGMITFYKTKDGHMYKRLNSEYVLHVHYEQGLMNIISPWTWDDVCFEQTKIHSPMIQITEEEFNRKAKSVMHVLSTHLYEK